MEMTLIADRRMGRTRKTQTSTASPDSLSLAVMKAGHHDSGLQTRSV